MENPWERCESNSPFCDRKPLGKMWIQFSLLRWKTLGKDVNPILPFAMEIPWERCESNSPFCDGKPLGKMWIQFSLLRWKTPGKDVNPILPFAMENPWEICESNSPFCDGKPLGKMWIQFSLMRWKALGKMWIQFSLLRWKTLGKDVNPILPFAMEKQLGRLCSSTLVWSSLKERKTLNSNLLNSAKNWPCVVTCSCWRVGKYIYVFRTKIVYETKIRSYVQVPLTEKMKEEKEKKKWKNFFF